MADDRPPEGPPDEGQTPLDPDEARGLKLSWVSTRGDLNDAEAANIIEGIRWGQRQVSRRNTVVAREDFLRALHKEMLGQVWAWAGMFRTTEKNIGVAPEQVATMLRLLFDDVAAWREYSTYSLDERAVRLHHRLTFIHPFPNGNGRSARVMADLYLQQHDAPVFSWGPAPHDASVRRRYLDALRKADGGDLEPLVAFVRS